MSYDIDYGQHDLNITSNITPMTKVAGLYLPDLHGKSGHEGMLYVGRCLRNLTSPYSERKYKKLEAKNGWGTLEHTVSFLTHFYFIMQDNPCEIIGVHN